MTEKNTIAQRIAARTSGGISWETSKGTDLADLLGRVGTCARSEDDHGISTYTFADGSAIECRGDCWDFPHVWARFDFENQVDDDHESCECGYCGALTHHDHPSVGDDSAWCEVAIEHLDGCEWVATRAHTVDAVDDATT